MSHQDRASKIVVNHQTIKQVVDQLLSARLFIGMKVRTGSLWKSLEVSGSLGCWQSPRCSGPAPTCRL